MAMAVLEIMQGTALGEPTAKNVVPMGAESRGTPLASPILPLAMPTLGDAPDHELHHHQVGAESGTNVESIPDSAVTTAGVLIRSHSLPILLAFAQKSAAAKNLAPQHEANPQEDVIDGFRRRLAIPETAGDLVKSITLPLATYRAVNEQLGELVQDDFLGLHAAEEAPRGSFGILEFVVRHTRNVDAALERTQRYWRLVSEIAQLGVEMRCGEVSLTFRVSEEPTCMGRHGNEFVLATFHRFLRDLTQQDLRAASVEFAHPAPASEVGVSELTRYFGTEQVRFDAAHNRISFDASVLSLPIPTSDERLLLWLDEYATSLLPPEPAAERAVPGLERQIRSCLHESVPPTVTEVARRLRISSRTLQRRLCEAHMSFYGVLESIRCELAERYLHDASLSIYEVALRLGYANERGFERAFMKWHGVTPRAYRRKLCS